MFKDAVSSSYFKEIPLSEILQIISNNNASANNNVSSPFPYTFELKTQNVSYYVGDNGDAARSWEHSLRQALMPVLSSGENKEISRNNQRPAVNNGNNYPIDENQNQNADILQQYHIFIDEILGAGQFGTVYSGVHRTSGQAVAIKIIDKSRFPTKQEAQLKNEVSILQNISHPGVVNLERMFENPMNIYVVMEKLSGDMLEMILNSEQGKLSERVTKFLIYQVSNRKILQGQQIIYLNAFPVDSGCFAILALSKHLPLWFKARECFALFQLQVSTSKALWFWICTHHWREIISSQCRR